jgi:hypothetical protein
MRIGQSGAYIIISIMSMIGSLLVWLILSCMVPHPKAVNPEAITFSVVFWIGLGWIKKSSRYGVTHHDAPESMIACVVSCVEAFVAINTAIINSLLFCKFVLV